MQSAADCELSLPLPGLLPYRGVQHTSKPVPLRGQDAPGQPGAKPCTAGCCEA